MKDNIKLNSLTIKIWKYLALFSIIILSFLWFFQVVFLNKYYRIVKEKEIKQVAKVIEQQKDSGNLSGIIDNITYNQSICIEITDNLLFPIQTSSLSSNGCISNFHTNYLYNTYKRNFINSNQENEIYELANSTFHNNTLIYAFKLDQDIYAFINTSIEPMNSTVSILKNQLIYVTILVLILSFLIAYFISKHISNPIIKINESAKKLANGKYDTIFTSNENIREINELIETLNYTRCELEKTDNLRRDLMANVSHDLKTPLTMIKAYAEMARDLNSRNIKKRKENLNIIIEEVDRLTILVNDILTLSKMQSELDILKFDEFDLISLIEDILRRYDFLVTKENYTFKFNHKSKEIIINADKKKIEQVIYNLINNAINYVGKDNLVEINIIENDVIRVEIKDYGKGIKKEDIVRIWDKYYKNEKKHKRNLIGTGLGLSIVKNILELHHYQYGVKSIINQGSTFYFDIPK